MNCVGLFIFCFNHQLQIKDIFNVDAFHVHVQTCGASFNDSAYTLSDQNERCRNMKKKLKLLSEISRGLFCN